MSATYDADTYDSETYDTGDETPIVKHGAPFSVFEWLTVDETKPVEEPVPLVQREIELTQSVSVKVHSIFKATHSITKLQRYVFKSAQTVARYGVSFAEIVKGYEAFRTNLKQGHERRNSEYTAAQAHDNAAWWATGGYCFCSKFSSVHSLSQCGRGVRENDE